MTDSIPSTLWQTWRNDQIPVSLQHSYESWNHSNSDLTRELHTDQQCAEFILKHFGQQVYNQYLAFALPIQRADFWRLAVIYIHGGYYADLDVACWAPLKDIVATNPLAVWMKEGPNIANFFFGATAGHPVLKMALDLMLDQANNYIIDDVQTFGMHWLHHSVQDYYQVIDNNYVDSDQVIFLNNHQLQDQHQLVHMACSGTELPDYDSWRTQHRIMLEERDLVKDLLFFTTFHKNGYELYGREWVQGFVRQANYFPNLRARIYYQGFEPDFAHPNIEWINFDQALPNHSQWKTSYLKQTTHAEYVRNMTVRFSHKAFVIQHALAHSSADYMIWLDGDCVFKNANYSHWPNNIMPDQFMACQVEQAHKLNHVESGILIFDATHPDTAKFNRLFQKNYSVKKILSMSQPYDGFVVYKTLLESKLSYVDLNAVHGAVGIQSNPDQTFLHPEIANKFVHNIGYTGKQQYQSWEKIYQRDHIYKKIKDMLFGNWNSQLQKKKQQARKKLASLQAIQQRNKSKL